jgi:rod shape-determining protein MreC
VPVALAVVCLALLSWSARGGTAVPARRAALEAAGPVAGLADRLAGAVEDLWLGYFNLVGTREENENLKLVLGRQSRQLVVLAEERLANERLRRMLGFHEQPPGRYLSARVVAWDPGPWFQSLVVSAGSDHGVTEDSPVLTDRGVVGRVVELSPGWSKVLLLTDSSSSIDSFVQRNRVPALLSGRGRDGLSLDYIRKSDDVRPGDLVVTSGLDGIFPPGLPLGSVTVVDKQSLGIFLAAQVSPLAELERLEEVLILVDRPQPLDWLGLAPDLRAAFEKRRR